MERWEWERTHRRGKDTVPHPSFSSSLLDAIYRSIDEADDPEAATCKLANKSQPKSGAPEPHPSKKHQYPHYHHYLAGSGRRAAGAISTSSSSESSYGGFSSSEPESCRIRHPHIPPPIVTGSKKAKGEGSIRSRFRPSRIYGELKKARPASPGGRLASFLNSLFATTSHRRKATQAAGDDSTCSSASSFSRSCLRGRSPSDGLRRSVRFCPVSVVVGDDPLPPPPPVRLRPVTTIAAEEKERDLIATVRDSKLGLGLGFEDDEEDDGDDGASYSSSDLFELEDLMAAGGEQCCYRDELPVYETTHVRTNLAIARGLVV